MMRVHEELDTLSLADFTNPIATVGVFDGLHAGHIKLISELRAWAKETGGESVVVTFRVHPRAVTAKSGPTHIMSLPHRLMLMAREGVDACVILDFTPELAAKSAEEFSREFLAGKLGIRGLLMGFDGRIGRGGEGTRERMAKLGKESGYEVRRVDAVMHGGSVISSTRIRRHIIAGELDEAQAMLGRPVSVLGTVVRGEGRGRKLGFPTANMDLHHEARPPIGVYAASAVFGESEMPAVVNIGRRPTFHKDGADETIEVHIPGFDGDLYDREVEVRFLRKIRDEKKFTGADELVERMRRDVEELRKITGGQA